MTRVREAATLMLVDDRPDLHVFMLRRNPRSVFGPGAFVFPGGAIDPADSDEAATTRVLGLDDREASARLGLPSGGLRVWIGALREAFEEAGILLAAPDQAEADGDPVAADGDLAAARVALNAGELSFADVLSQRGLVLDLRDVFLFAHWLTPEGAPRRFDTWFLVAPAPHGQEGSHDDAELVHSEWVRPADALARYAAGDLDLIFPTLRTLRVLESFATVAALLDEVRSANEAADRPPFVVADASGCHIALRTDDGATAVRGWPVLTSKPEVDVAALLAEDRALARGTGRGLMADLTPGVASALSPLVRRIVAPNPGLMTGPGTNTYLVGIDEVAVIDPGPDDPGHVEAIIGASMSERVRWVLLTHTHPDHWPAAATIAKRTGAEIAGFSKFPKADEVTLKLDRVLNDGDVVEGTEFGLEVLHTPGHAPNHLCFLLEEERVLFTGDHVLDGTTTVISPQRGGDMAEYMKSLERLRKIRRIARICPAHGDVIEEPYARLDEYVKHRRMRERQIVKVLGEGPTKITDIVARLYTETPEGLRDMAGRQVHAHLLKLRAEGKVAGTGVRSPWKLA